MGVFWDAIQAELDRERFAPSNRRLAAALGVAPSTITNWRDGLTELPKREHLESVARFIGETYESVLLLALSESDHGKGTRLERPAARNKYLDAAVTELRAAREKDEK